MQCFNWSDGDPTIAGMPRSKQHTLTQMTEIQVQADSQGKGYPEYLIWHQIHCKSSVRATTRSNEKLQD